ncbi:TonB-dependent siderophore receptor [Roseivivax sp. GX 12232]|uniref:TonB-dependent siderophore receptor n=1 Tax=Roseivivax sp. GX 12232 TaxID=2900547 RepID=UPI001E3E8B23|nr:TonB-dependent siderophore receptor [Roseivivax sp. GX 12232]MCE0504019.1 TonB-dependent siderophore receptor [Roseivivax sp. GX 12232]
MHRMYSSLSVCALVAAGPALAQDIALEAITVEDDSGARVYGDPVALDTRGVTRFDRPIAETPRSVNVVTAQEMLDRGATDVEEALSYATGVNAGQWGNDARSDWYNIRGFDPTTFHDGLISRQGFYNDVKPEPFLLESVEVLRGPASGLYGNGEVGGVVNTTSKTAAQDSPGIAQLSFGNHARKQIGLDVGGDLTEDGRLAYRFVGLYRDAETHVQHSQDDALALMPSLTWRPSTDTEVTLLARYQKNEATPDIQFGSIYGTLYDAPNGKKLESGYFVGEPGFDRFDAEHASVTGLVSHRFSEVWSLDARARYTWAEADYRHAWWAFDDYPTRYNADGTIDRTVYKAENTLESFNIDVTGRADYRLFGWEMETLIGAAYTRATYDSDTAYGMQNGPIDPFDPDYTGVTIGDVTDSPANTVEETGVYLQTNARWNDRLHLDAGLRYGMIETGETTGTFNDGAVAASDDAVTGNLALLYRFDNGLAPYVSYAESFRQEVVGEDAQGNAFEPTRGRQYEIGLKYQPAGSDTLLTLAAFDIEKSNLAVTDPDNPAFQVQTGEATSRGIEIGAKHHFGDVFVDAGYTWLETENASGDRISQVPSDFGSLWVDWRPQGGALDGWSFGAGVRHTGEKWDGTDSQRTPPSTVYDAALGWSQGDFDLRLNVRNLTDERVVSFCGTGACYMGQGRSVTLTGTMTF